MDGGEVLPGMDEGWTFAGARLMEWGSGLVVAMLVQELFFSSPAKTMPLFIAIIVGITFTLASLRKSFPDEERGVANYMMTKLGVSPPGMPTPAELQPLWSGLPLQVMHQEKEFIQLGLLDVFPHGDLDEDDELQSINDQMVH